MKAISDTITTLIIAGTIIMVSLTVFYYSIANLQYATLSAEYGYIRSVFLGIADSIPDIIEGGTYGARLPSRLVGVGYLNLSDTMLNLMVINDTNTIFNYTDTPMALHASTYASLVVRERRVYGVDSLIVNETLLIPRIREYYLEGATHLVLDTARFYVKIYSYETNGEIVYIVNVIYVKLSVKITSSKPVQITVSLGRDLVNERLVDVDDVVFTRNVNGVVETVSLDDLIPNMPANAVVVVNIVVKNVDMVIS